MPAATTATAPTTAAEPRRRRKAARPQELLAAALDCFVEKGFAATRTEEVAQRAGVAKGTLYLYYPSKEDLLEAVISHYVAARIDETAQQIEAYQGPTAPLFEDLLVRWWQRAYDSPASAVFKIMIAEGRSFPAVAEHYLHAVVEPGHALIARIVERGIARGEFRHVEVEHVVHSLLLPMVMLCTHKHALGACTEHHIDAHAFIAAHVALVLQGLREPARGILPGRNPPPRIRP